MLTVGLVKELFFITKALNTSVKVDLKADFLQAPLKVAIAGGVLDIFYRENHIWRENLASETSMFGVESCDAISRILAGIDGGGEWLNLVYLEENASEEGDYGDRMWAKEQKPTWTYGDEREI
jgi:hypothetical protein